MRRLLFVVGRHVDARDNGVLCRRLGRDSELSLATDGDGNVVVDAREASRQDRIKTLDARAQAKLR